MPRTTREQHNTLTPQRQAGLARPAVHMRFEHGLRLQCQRGHAPVDMVCLGNLSLREAGAPATVVSYECRTCWQRVAVSDREPTPTAADLAAIDSTE